MFSPTRKIFKQNSGANIGYASLSQEIKKHCFKDTENNFHQICKGVEVYGGQE